MSEQVASNIWPVRVIRPPVPVGHWTNFGEAVDWLQQIAPPTCLESPMLLVLDLNGIVPMLAILLELLDHLLGEIRSGRFGLTGIVVSTQDPGIQRYVQMLGASEPGLYLSESTTYFSLIQAAPATPFTSTEQQTLQAVMNAGGTSTAKEIAKRLGIGHTAAINRLNTLVDAGLLFRQNTPGRSAHVYIDPRVTAVQSGERSLVAALEFEQTRAASPTSEEGSDGS